MAELPPAADSPRREPRSNRSKIILGIVIAIVVFVLLLAVVSIFAVPNARNIARDHLIEGARQAIDASSLTAAEKSDAAAAVREFLTRAVADRIPQDKLDGVRREVMAGHYGRLLEIMALQRAIEKSGLDQERRTVAQANIQILFNAYVKALITDAEIAPVVKAIPKDERDQPAQQPWKDADLDEVLAQAASIGGTYAELCRLAAIPRAIDKSNLTSKEKAAPLENARILSDAYFRQRVSYAELAPVFDAIPIYPMKVGEPLIAKLPWERWDLDRVMSQIASIAGPAGRLMQIAAVRRAIEKSPMTDDEKSKAQKIIKKLSTAYAQNVVSDAEIEPVIKAIPMNLGRAGEPVPARADFEPVLTAAETAVKDKEVRPDAKLPDFPDEIRRAVKMMKDASAAADDSGRRPSK